MELDHFSHPDHKLSYKKSVKRGEKPEDCAACRDEISSEHYSCSRCDFFLHKFCAELPHQISYTLHPLHPLHLHLKSPYGGGKNTKCYACDTMFKGFGYHCAICNFDLDIKCAMPDGSSSRTHLEMLKVNHMSHPQHLLTLEKAVKRTKKKGLVCVACCDEISSEHYYCSRCHFFIHKTCAERPLELSHSLHPLHPLHHNVDGTYIKCSACWKRIEGFIYDCAICRFCLDFRCAFPDGLKLNHRSHLEHVLTFQKAVKQSDKGVNCPACRDEISSEHYSCSECNFFLHKLCAELPHQISYTLHPLHPLHLHPKSPYDDGLYPECDACDTVIEGFIYHCAICKFDLDIICAMPDGLTSWTHLEMLKVNHMSHPQHLLTFEKAVKRTKKGLVCVACLREILGQLAEYYSCRRCDVFLHKVCFEAPLEVTRSWHIHPLQLIPHNPYGTIYMCAACGGILNGALYHCNLCSFTIHLRCAGRDWKPDYSAFPGWTKLSHSCHPHILTLEKKMKKADERRFCQACLHLISGSLTDYYSCRKCNFFLHQVCGERPQELIHSLHPEHTLTLKLDQKPWNGFFYDCQCNQFRIKFKYAFPFNIEKRIQNREEIHHHPLILVSRASKISCDFCLSTPGDEGEEEQSYACSTCDFMIHRSCALTELARKFKEHEHPLSIVQGIREDLQIYRFYCYVCYYPIDPDYSVAHCARCRYFVHASCLLIEKTIMDDVDYLNTSLIQFVLNDTGYVHWPPRDVSSKLIQPFLLGKNGIVMNAQPKIRHSSHKEHDMVLFQELSVNNDSFFKEEDEEILCDGCIHPITAPYYCCQDCNYYLHLPCANLPQKISHSSHPYHELDLSYLSRCSYKFTCDHCGRDCNGFSYRCQKCDFHIDVTCAALPSAIVHKSHEHALVQTKQVCEGVCYCCKRYALEDDIIFKCRSCDVYLHYNCAMYSKSIRHRWDRQHPLDLRCPPQADHPDHIMCDMCEKLIDPMDWLYSCFKCKVYLHTDCTPNYKNYPNMKYGEKVKISFHPHILNYLMKATLKIHCDKCYVPFGDYPVFECETCYYCICYECGVQRKRFRAQTYGSM